MQTTFIIPCFNEAEGIPQLCRRLREIRPVLMEGGQIEFLFVDDGSTDGTADVIRREALDLPYRIVAHEQNRGLGAALRTGFAESRGQEIVTLDSDCTYDPLQAVDLLKLLRNGNEVVTGSPYHPQGRVVNIVRWRLMISRALSYLYWLVLPVHLYTYTSCFRAYRREILPNLEARDDGFLAVTQLLVSAILQGLVVAEMPATLTSRRFGRSKIRAVKVALSHLRYLLHIVRVQLAPEVEPQPVALHTTVRAK
jgi:dolichol-phosphate mannosyltransferase